ncbi:MAG TPA: TIGR04255 family protein [Xanthobacteraceae bacterium]|jgi:uncharacterized protein (TIGR04255 family)|nr:TIGR04255 family protein [Xanthobacteraceae bacterium]
MGKKMKNAPVYFVLAQVRFNAVLTLDSYVPAIQDALRKAGYADFAKLMISTVNLNLGVPATANQMPVAQTARYLFLNEKKFSGFLLDQASLIFQTTEYETFDPFRDAFLLGLKTLNESVGGLSFCERIGIRFLDAIIPNPNEKITDYLAPSLVGLLDKLNERQLKHVISETWSTSDQANLMCRAVIQDQTAKGVSFAPDLQPMLLQVAEKFRETSGIYGIIDTDAWYENRQKFDIDKIKEKLISLHGDVRDSFDEMVTPHAFSVWE